MSSIICATLGAAKATIRDHGALGADYARRPRALAWELPRGSSKPPVTQAIGNDGSWPRADRKVWAIELTRRALPVAHRCGNCRPESSNCRSSCKVAVFRQLAARDAHVARDRGGAERPVDNEVMTFGLAGDGFADRRMQAFVALRGAQRRPQIGGVFVSKAHVERPRARHAHAIAAFAEIVGERRDEADEC